MKTTLNYLKRFTAVTLALLFVSVAVFADGETTEVYLSGTTNTAAGDFVVTGTDAVYHFQGQEYNVYNVYYDDPSVNHISLMPTDTGLCTTALEMDLELGSPCLKVLPSEMDLTQKSFMIKPSW